MNGWKYIARQLDHLGVQHVFGLPGTQNAELFSELAITNVQIVPSSSEKAAGFAAIGYALASGRPGLLLTIAGPGFCYTAAPLVEALHDSVPLVNIVIGDAKKTHKQFQLQDIDHEGLAGRMAKSVRQVSSIDELSSTLEWAWQTSISDEPGPVVVLLTSDILNFELAETRSFDIAECFFPPDEPALDEVVAALSGKRVLIFAGRGAAAAHDEIAQLARNNQWPVMTTASGRGVIDETDAMSLRIDGSSAAAVNSVMDNFEVVLAVGVKFTHNGSFGFGLELPQSKLIHVDASKSVLNANYPALHAIQADSVSFCRQLLTTMKSTDVSAEKPDVARLRKLLDVGRADSRFEPIFDSRDATTAKAFFGMLQDACPDDSIFVTDSGYHQVLARRHLVARFPGQLNLPTDFQSMGYGLPAAIGIALAKPNCKIVVIHGDGGLQMCATDLLTIAAENLNILVCVLVDGSYGLIRRQQLASGDRESGVTLTSVDYAGLATAFGVRHVDCAAVDTPSVAEVCSMTGPVLMKTSLRDSKAQIRAHAASRLKGEVRNVIGDSIMGWVRKRRKD